MKRNEMKWKGNEMEIRQMQEVAPPSNNLRAEITL